ncbi:MAG: NAD-dependent deacetylase [Propionibacteriaceae bacterium]|nr:NAD-dependent deacetylase [Propionibacteriaceae bacterium]
MATPGRVRPSAWMPSAPDGRPPAGPEDLEAAITVLNGRRWTALTGAGISTDSGIPDYRGPDSRPRNPMTYQQFVGDPGFRRHYWARNHLGWHHLRHREPNRGHRALASLEARGLVAGVITQNVDLLHQAAGSRRVIDLHGHYNEVICLECGHRISRAALDERLLKLNPGFLDAVAAVTDIEIAPDADAVIEETASFVVADCRLCGGVLKPDITYFGESVPPTRVAAAYTLIDEADALVVAGTSLAVMSGLRFVRRAAAAGKPVVIINRGLTRGDSFASLRLNAGTSEALGLLAERL